MFFANGYGKMVFKDVVLGYDNKLPKVDDGNLVFGNGNMVFAPGHNICNKKYSIQALGHARIWIVIHFLPGSYTYSTNISY